MVQSSAQRCARRTLGEPDVGGRTVRVPEEAELNWGSTSSSIKEGVLHLLQDHEAPPTPNYSAFARSSLVKPSGTFNFTAYAALKMYF